MSHFKAREIIFFQDYSNVGLSFKVDNTLKDVNVIYIELVDSDFTKIKLKISNLNKVTSDTKSQLENILSNRMDNDLIAMTYIPTRCIISTMTGEIIILNNIVTSNFISVFMTGEMNIESDISVSRNKPYYTVNKDFQEFFESQKLDGFPDLTESQKETIKDLDTKYFNQLVKEIELKDAYTKHY